MATRRDFLNVFRKSSEKKKESSPLVVRPPYGLSESLFQSECIICENKACVASCDEQIILIGGDGTAMLNFSKSGCTFCEECAKACEKNGMSTLNLGYEHYAEKTNAVFRISTEGCVAHHGTICFSCKEPCIDDAILFNGMFNPVIDMDKCTGCGFCMGRCPTQAISYFPTEIAHQEELSL